MVEVSPDAASRRPQPHAGCTRPESEARIGLCTVQELVYILGQRRPVLEPVPGPAAENPDSFVLGMPGDEEVRVRRQGVRTGPRRDHRRPGQAREPLRDVRARGLLVLGLNDALVVLGIE